MARPNENLQDPVLFRELVNQIYSQLPAVLLTSLLLLGLVVLVLWRVSSPVVLLSWTAALCLVCVLRYVLYGVYRARGENHLADSAWMQLYSWGAILGGVVWAAAPLLFYSPASPQTNVFIAFVLGGLVSGASGAMAPLHITMCIFTGLLCLPIALLFLMHGGSLHTVMGLMMLIYGVAYILMSRHTGRTIIEALGLREKSIREREEREKAQRELQKVLEGLEDTVDRRAGEIRRTNDKLTREIAERQRAEKRLRTSEKRYRALVESVSDWIWEVDTDGVYTYSSPGVERELGYKPDEVVGRTFDSFMAPDEADRARKLFEQCSSAGKPLTGLVNRCLHKDGSERVLETNGEPVFDRNGKLKGFRGIDRDCTLRIKHEEERRKLDHLESLGMLAGGIAHDFNNLLTAVFCGMDLARDALPEGSEAAQALAASTAAMEQARTLTGQLLTFSKGGTPTLSSASVGELIQSVCDFSLSGSSVRCEYDLAEDLSMVEVDKNQIWQVLNNILANAREAMPGGGTLHVAAANVAIGEVSTLPLEPGDYVRLEFRDDGVGIPETDMPRVFDPYFSTKARGNAKGTGIGLAVCLSIVEQHGGHITIESVEGDGTLVTLYLRARSAGDAPAVEEETEPEATRPAVLHNLLLLEDDDVVAGTTTRLLKRLGHTVTVIQDGKDAVDAYVRAREEGRPFDIVILDLTIRGGMGGLDAMESLKKVDPGIVAVVTSGYTEDDAMANFETHGFRAALPKPYSIQELRDLLVRLEAR